MTAADVWLVLTDLLQAPNNSLIAAAPLPGSGLPQLQSELFGNVSFGYGDLFVAGLLGAVLAREGRRQGPMALLTFVLAGLFDLLFFVAQRAAGDGSGGAGAGVGEAWGWRRRRHAARRPGRRRPGSTRVEAAAGG